jgi:hypothetical protein
MPRREEQLPDFYRRAEQDQAEDGGFGLGVVLMKAEAIEAADENEARRMSYEVDDVELGDGRKLRRAKIKGSEAVRNRPRPPEPRRSRPGTDPRLV